VRSRRRRTEAEKFQTDPHWRDCVLFYEYFHGDNGAGIGASHQTGWTGLVATLIHWFGNARPADVLTARSALAAGLEASRQSASRPRAAERT
jgi:hypothetical protein